jgi:hypothetical protein
VFVGYDPGNGPRDIQEIDFRSVLPQTQVKERFTTQLYKVNE